MAAELELTFLGGVQLRLGATDVTQELSAKGQALLCYLAVTGKTHTRSMVANLLWGDKPEADARRSLRVDLVPIRRVLGDYLKADRQSVAFNRDKPYRLDVEAFITCVQRGQRSHGAVDADLLQEAVDLYRGEFMAGFDARDAMTFEDWMMTQADYLERQACRALFALVTHYREQCAYEQGIACATRLLDLDPWNEEVYRQLMWLLARSGQRGAALAQYDAWRELLAGEWGIEPSRETKELYQEIRQMKGQPVTQTIPLPPLPKEPQDVAVPFQAPPRVPYFLGRAAELAQLRPLLTTTDRRRIYALVGMGGVGKTSLATHAAHDLRHAFPDGVLWADAATSTPLDIADQWAEAYGYDFSTIPDGEARLAALRRVLVEKSALLVVDDVVVASAIRPLLPQSQTCAILLTTRNVELAQALDAIPIDTDELQPQDSHLLLERIVGEERIAQEPDAAAAIGALLEHLPLAMTIAARYLAYRPRRRLSDFVRRLRDETERLDLQQGARQVRASFAISWNALDQFHRDVFAQVAVFDGRSFTTDAVAAITDVGRFLAQDRLDHLVDLSLLSAAPNRRYRQHALLADFAREKLEDDELPLRHMVAYFSDYAAEHAQAYEALRPEWENLSASVRVAHEHHLWPTVLEFTRSLRDAWFARGRFDAARRAFAIAQEAAMALEDEEALADTWFHGGQACLEQSRNDDARQHLEASLDLYRELAAERGIAAAQYELARLALEQGEYGEAENRLEESRQIYAERDDKKGLARALYRQARLQHRRVQNEEARKLAETAVSLQEQLDDMPGLVRTLRLLSFIRQGLGDFDDALACGQQALELAKTLQDKGEIAMALYTVASAQKLLGALQTAEETANRSLALLEQMGDRGSQLQVQFQIMRVKKLAGDFEEAKALAYELLALSRELEDRWQQAYLLFHLGDLHVWLDEAEQARQCWTESLVLARPLSLTKSIAIVERQIALLDRGSQGRYQR